MCRKMSNVFGKTSHVFGKTSDVFIGCLEKNESHFRGVFYRAPCLSLLHLSRACACAHTLDFALFAFTTFTKMGVVYWNTTPCEGIRNGVLQKNTKVRLLEEMRGTIFGGEIAWFVSHFYENSTPTGEGCESKKCMFAGNARVYARKLTLYFSSFEVSRLYWRG